MTQHRTVRPFTGRHMAAILISFFAVIIAVNVLMARLATSTFGGVVVENSYVASQKFNGWLDAARSEKALGWKAEIARADDGRLQVTLRDSAGTRIAAAAVSATAEHPLGLRDDIALVLKEGAPGHYAAALPAGRWRIKLVVRSEGRTWRTVGEVG